MAFLLRHNPPEAVREVLEGGTWTNREVTDIVHLLTMNQWASKYGKDHDGFFGGFYDQKNHLHTRTNLVPSLVKKWGELNGHDPHMLKKYLGHEMTTRGYVRDDVTSGRVVNPQLIALYGRTPEGPEFGHGIRHLETERFRTSLEEKREV